MRSFGDLLIFAAILGCLAAAIVGVSVWRMPELGMGGGDAFWTGFYAGIAMFALAVWGGSNFTGGR